MNPNENTNENPERAPLQVECSVHLTPMAKRLILTAENRIAQDIETIRVPFDPAYVDRISMGRDKLTAPTSYPAPKFDALPMTLAEYFQVVDSHIAKLQAAREAEQAAQEQARRDRIERDRPAVEQIIKTLQAGPGEDGKRCFLNQAIAYSPEDLTTVKVLIEDWNRRIEERDNARREAEEAAEKEQRAQYGGTPYPLEAGYTAFRGNWMAGQSKRWVGVFTEARGIDRFLDSPKDEHTFHVAGLKRGDCIQMGGYDTNSRGRRRNESEAFGVVVMVSPDLIVVDEQPSRSACFKAADKLRRKDTAKAETAGVF